MKDQQFTILIGSWARGTGDACSDIDIVRIGHTRAAPKVALENLPNPSAPISYIDYDFESFMSLYETGSLFLHHIMTEGKLLSGDPAGWSKLVAEFSVTRDLSSEIEKQLNLCKWLAQPESFANASMPLLSHLFKALKNAAIFSLAQQGVYVYDKREALKRSWQFLTDKDIELLVSANNVYVRDVPPTSTLDINVSNALRKLCSKVNLAIGELSQNGNKKNPRRNPRRSQRSRELQLRRRKKSASRRF